MARPLSEPGKEYLNRQQLPSVAWVVLISTLAAVIPGELILGYQMSAFGWLVPLLVSIHTLIRTSGKVRFPFVIWLPWICLVSGYLLVASAENALQRSVMLLTPIVVGMAVSKYAVTEEGLRRFSFLCDYFWKALLVVVLVKSGIVLTGVLPEVTGMAAEAITASLLAVVFAAQYAMGRQAGLLWWAAMAAIPVIAVTRSAIVVSAIALPFTFAPLAPRKRAISLAIICILAFGVFYTERMQNKMFYSGEGTIADMSRENPDFKTSGRTTIIDAMEREVELSPWWGHGANASEEFVLELTEVLRHPHNDWLRIAYDYGYFGVVVFALTLVLQAWHALRRAFTASGEKRVLYYAGASSFVSFALLMFTDNIILYAAFFGNVQFAILGLAYGSEAEEVNGLWASQAGRVS